MRAGRGRQRQGAARGPQAATLGRPSMRQIVRTSVGTTVASPKPSDALEDALRAFYAVHAPQKAKDAPQIAAVFRRDFEAMDDRLFRKYGARLQLPNDAASSDDDSSDDEAEAVLAAPGASRRSLRGAATSRRGPCLVGVCCYSVFDVPAISAPV